MLNIRLIKQTAIIIGAIALCTVGYFTAQHFLQKPEVIKSTENTNASDTKTPTQSATSKQELAATAVATASPPTETPYAATNKSEEKPSMEQKNNEDVDKSASVSDNQQKDSNALKELLNGTCYNSNDFMFEQLVVVDTYGNNAQVSFYQKDSDGSWKEGLPIAYGYIGRNGVTSNKYEGDGCTPLGLYTVGEGFFIDNSPPTKLDLFKITQNTYWVDDPSSIYYNQRVEATDTKQWDSAEHMIGYYSNYKYGFVINYNTSTIIAGDGSAIFFHCGTTPTAGCVSLPESDVLQFLSALDKNKNPHILII